MPQENTTDEQIQNQEVKPVSAQPKASVDGGIMNEVIDKINEAKNVLIALSSDPSVDEMAAAIGLSLYLDRQGKRATAIYSGATPNALEFLKPEDRFETTADTLQDFVIAINKEKADHLRYKLDGDYVKIFVTPYRTRIAESDLEFSYGDYNVDLVLALDVANGIDLDSALREHGRIMHDASIINITTGNPGKFGEVEWSDKSASSVSEMIAGMLYGFGENAGLEKDEATAFLTGIVAATNRFSNSSTTPKTMQMASKLMESGANQQLVSKNITPDVSNEVFDQEVGSEKSHEVEEKNSVDEASEKGANAEKSDTEGDGTSLEVTHNVPTNNEESVTNESPDLDGNKGPGTEVAENGASNTGGMQDIPVENESENAPSASENVSNESATSQQPSVESAPTTSSDQALLDDLKSAEQSLAHAGAETTPVNEQTTIKIDTNSPQLPTPVDPLGNQGDTVTGSVASGPSTDFLEDKPQTVIQPSAGFDANAPADDVNKYGQMLQDALDLANQPMTQASGSVLTNPAMASAPMVSGTPEINGVPELNYMPMPGQDILPPPPAPPVQGMPVDSSMGLPSAGIPPMGTPSATMNTEPSVMTQPTDFAGQTTGTVGQPTDSGQMNDVGAFKIPGM